MPKPLDGDLVKRISLWLMSTLTVLVLLFGYHTSTSSRAAGDPDSSAVAPISGGSPTTSNGATESNETSTGSTNGSTTVPTPDPSSNTSPASPSSVAAAVSSTVTGSVASTRWGPVQVQLTVADGQISDVSVVQYPHENGKDQQINARAIPVLINETLAAQTSNIDMVSGATITSEGYVASLQSAIDQAGL